MKVVFISYTFKNRITSFNDFGNIMTCCEGEPDQQFYRDVTGEISKQLRETKLINEKDNIIIMSMNVLYEENTNKRKIVTLCGSTRFKKAFEYANKMETLDGNIVLSCGVWGHSDPTVRLSDAQKEELDKLHFDKIKMSDEVIFINTKTHLGESTNKELEYCRHNDINYRLEEIDEELI